MTASGDGSEASSTDAPAEKSAAGHVMHEAVWRGNGGLEIVMMPALTGFLGFVLDQTVGTSPLFLITFAVLGFIGSVASQYYRYTDQMAAIHAASAQRREAAKNPEASSFGQVEQVEFATYVVEDVETESSK